VSIPAEATLEELREENAKLAQQNVELTARVRWFEEQQRLFLLRQYAASSEKSTARQRALIFNEAEAEVDAALLVPEPTEETITYRRRKAKGDRASKLKDLPIETVPYELAEHERVCPCCQGLLHRMGEEVRQEFKYVPATLTLVHHVRGKYTCRYCQENEITTPVLVTPMPTPAFPGSLASPSAVAHIMSQKYGLALPLYRQEKALAHLGIDLSRQTMANWTIKGADWFAWIYKRLQYHLLTGDIQHADETSLQVLREPGRSARTESYLWLYRTGREGPAIVLFEYQRTRAGMHPESFLKDFGGYNPLTGCVEPRYLHVDGYPGYDGVPKVHLINGDKVPDVILVGCWAHARRGFKEALAIVPKELRLGKTAAEQGLAFCNKLFAIERQLKDATTKERYEARIERSQPLMKKFHTWMKSMVDGDVVLPKGPTASAINYCLGQWAKLNAFLLDGRLEIDNNRAERSIKPFVIGRKNWLFANTVSGATASAIIYSIVETAKENGLIPFEYMKYLFEALPNIDTQDENALDNLLPWATSIPQHCKAPIKSQSTEPATA
jgi:transposase